MRHPNRLGITLVEILMVVALVGIVVGMVVQRFDPGVVDQLQSSAFIVAADLDYARNLAISNNSQYSVTFDLPNNCYFIYHSGTDSALETLPRSPFLVSDTNAVYGPRQIADLDDLLKMGPQVALYSVRLQTSATAVTSIEFNPLGGMNSGEGVLVTLACGEGSSRRYLTLTIGLSGLVSIGDPRTAP